MDGGSDEKEGFMQKMKDKVGFHKHQEQEKEAAKPSE